jgi:protoheme IX farnesyltransferase
MMGGRPTVIPAPAAGPAQSKGRARSVLGTIVTLFKLRVVLLLLFAAAGGAVLAAAGGAALSGWDMLLLLISGGMSAAGASALNQYIERERDGLMQRTRRRPLVAGALRRPWWAVAAGLGLVGLATLIALPFNAPLAFFNLLGAIIYVAVYTLWLKPRTLLNIIIGGAAGSCAVLSGGAAVGAWSDPGVWLLALLVFAWTPTHFWSLALAYRDDYAQADVPMLPVHTSPRRAAGWILLHTALTGLAALSLATRPGLGLAYALTAVLATLWLWQRSIQLWNRPARQTAMALFVSSNAYLGLILLAICAQVLVRSWLF